MVRNISEQQFWDPEWWIRLSGPSADKPDTGGPSVAEQTIQLTLMTYFWWAKPVYVLVGMAMVTAYGGAEAERNVR
jgi:hypothetical protein